MRLAAYVLALWLYMGSSSLQGGGSAALAKLEH